MIFDKKEISTKHYSILLKGAATTIVIRAEEMILSTNKQYYEFFINDNLIALLPLDLIENIV